MQNQFKSWELSAQPQNPEITLLVCSWFSCIFLSLQRFGQKVSVGPWDRDELGRGREKLLRPLSLFIQYCHDHTAGTLLWKEQAHAKECLIYIVLHFSEVSIWENSACLTVTNLNYQKYLCCTWVKSFFSLNIFFVSFFIFGGFFVYLVFLVFFVLFWWWWCCYSFSRNWGSDIPWLIPSYLAVGELRSQALTSYFWGALLICRNGNESSHFSLPTISQNPGFPCRRGHGINFCLWQLSYSGFKKITIIAKEPR